MFATTWARIHLHLLNRCLPLSQAREIVQAWWCGVLQYVVGSKNVSYVDINLWTRLSTRADKWPPTVFVPVLRFNAHGARSFAEAHLWIAKWWTQGDVPGGSGASHV